MYWRGSGAAVGLGIEVWMAWFGVGSPAIVLHGHSKLHGKQESWQQWHWELYRLPIFRTQGVCAPWTHLNKLCWYRCRRWTWWPLGVPSNSGYSDCWTATYSFSQPSCLLFFTAPVWKCLEDEIISWRNSGMFFSPNSSSFLSAVFIVKKQVLFIVRILSNLNHSLFSFFWKFCYLLTPAKSCLFTVLEVWLHVPFYYHPDVLFFIFPHRNFSLIPFSMFTWLKGYDSTD